jgi:hypothetical protein
VLKGQYRQFHVLLTLSAFPYSRICLSIWRNNFLLDTLHLQGCIAYKATVTHFICSPFIIFETRPSLFLSSKLPKKKRNWNLYYNIFSMLIRTAGSRDKYKTQLTSLILMLKDPYFEISILRVLDYRVCIEERFWRYVKLSNKIFFYNLWNNFFRS